MNELIQLFTVFARIGAVTFGGGYAMLPILQREVVEKKGWATEEELTDYFAIGQCTPGVIAVNTATFCGTQVPGASPAASSPPWAWCSLPSSSSPSSPRFSAASPTPPWSSTPWAHQRLCGGADRRQRAEAGKEHPEKRPRRVHFSGGSGPGGGGQPAASGPRLPRRRGAGLPLLPRHPGGAGRSNGLVTLPARPGKEGGEAR